MEKRKLVTVTLAVALALTIGTITSFASDTAVSAAGEVIGLYPLAHSIVIGASKGHSNESEQPKTFEGSLTTEPSTIIKPEVSEIPTS